MTGAWTPPIRVTIAQAMGGVAACGFVCACPWLLLLVVPIAAVWIMVKFNSVPRDIMFVAGLPGASFALLLPMTFTARKTNCLRVAAAPAIDRLTTDGKEKARPIWSPDGKRLAFARHESGSTYIWQYLMDAGDEKSARRLTDRKSPEFHAAFLPEGKRLLFATVAMSGTQGDLDVSIVGADGSGLKKVVGNITGKLAHQDWPSPSPSGDRFAFSSTHEGNQEIYTCKVDGSNVVRVTQSPGHDAHPNWSPKGDRIAFATDRWGGMEIAGARPDGTGLTRLTTSPGIDDFPAISPDGSRVAFVSHRTGDAEVFVMAADGSDPINLTNNPGRDTQPCWTPDGTGITFVSDREGGCDLYTVTAPSRTEARR